MGMSFCLTVQGEQPITPATPRISRGGPRVAPGARRNGPGSRSKAAGWGGQWLGQGCPRENGGNAHKRADLRAPRTGVIGEDEEPCLILEFGSLMAMIVSIRSVKQFGK